MIYCHGTTLDAAKQIQREGLRKVTDKAFKILGVRSLPVIYLNPYFENAKGYAEFRAIYERVPYGTDLTGVGPTRYTGIPWTKLTHERNPQAQPAVVSFDVPASIQRQLKQDPDSYSGRICECSIPPEYVRSVTEVR